MDVSDLKSINSRILGNITNFGDSSNAKQSSLQFNIWKQCIEQREKDEMLFTVLISLILIFLGALVVVGISDIRTSVIGVYNVDFFQQ